MHMWFQYLNQWQMIFLVNVKTIWLTFWNMFWDMNCGKCDACAEITDAVWRSLVVNTLNDESDTLGLKKEIVCFL